MAVNVVIQSNQGTYQGGTFVLGPTSITSSFTSLAVISFTFTSAIFASAAAPQGAFGALIEPPSGNLVALTLKGVTGDVGVQIAANLPTLIPFFNPQATTNSIGLASAGAIPGVVTITFF